MSIKSSINKVSNIRVFFIFLVITNIECWPVFKQDPNCHFSRNFPWQQTRVRSAPQELHGRIPLPELPAVLPPHLRPGVRHGRQDLQQRLLPQDGELPRPQPGAVPRVPHLPRQVRLSATAAKALHVQIN